MRRLIWAFAVRICPKAQFCMARPIWMTCVHFWSKHMVGGSWFFKHLILTLQFFSSNFENIKPKRKATVITSNTKVINKPAHDKTYNKTCATSEDSDQPAHPRSLIRVFAERMCLLQPLDYKIEINENPCHIGWMYVQVYLSLCWSYRFYCMFVVVFFVRWLLIL